MNGSKQGIKGLKILAITAAVLLILVFVVVPVVATYLIDIDKYRPRVAERLSEKTGKEVEIGRLSLSFVCGARLTANDVSIKDPGLADEKIFSAPSVTAKASLIHLFKGELRLRKIMASAPELNLVKYGDGKLNVSGLYLYADPEMSRESYGTTGGVEIVPAAFTSGDGVWDLLKREKVSVKAIEIEKGRFTYSVERAEGKASKLIKLNGIDLTVGSIDLPTETDDSRNTFESDELSAEIDGKMENAVFYETEISSVDLIGSIKNGEALVRELTFSIYGGTARVAGVLRYAAEKPTGELSIKAKEVLFHELLNSFSDEENLVVGTMNMNGDFTFPLKGSGFTDGIVGRGKITVADGTVPNFSIRTELAKSLKIPPATLPEELDTGDFTSMGGSYNIKSGRLTTNDFETVGPTYNSTTRGYLGFDGTLDFSGYIYPAEEIVESSLFEKITSYVGIGGKLTEIPFTVTGTLDNVKFKISYEGLLKSGDGGDSKSLKDLGKSILKDILK